MTVWVYRADRQYCQMVNCDLNLLNGVTKKLLHSAKILVTDFHLKTAKNSEILLKNPLFLK